VTLDVYEYGAYVLELAQPAEVFYSAASVLFLGFPLPGDPVDATPGVSHYCEVGVGWAVLDGRDNGLKFCNVVGANEGAAVFAIGEDGCPSGWSGVSTRSPIGVYCNLVQ